MFQQKNQFLFGTKRPHVTCHTELKHFITLHVFQRIKRTFIDFYTYGNADEILHGMCPAHYVVLSVKTSKKKFVSHIYEKSLPFSCLNLPFLLREIISFPPERFHISRGGLEKLKEGICENVK